jgi:hypothetical protein
MSQIETGLLTLKQVAGRIGDTLAARSASLSEHG